MTSALGCAGLATSAFAQAAPAAGGNSNQIEEVVVTATRQTSTVNKVALSVSAVTQKSLDQQGIRSVADLANQVPGFTFRTTGNDNNPNLTLRGIGGNALNGTSGGAPTTGLYVDDVPLMSRNANGLETGSGTPQPLLYDLDRIEVLRGPQGTLYGGSSEGGTIRFITPQPSLTTYSGTARVGWSTMTGGGMGNEEGLALGGPLIQDKLGFRIAGYRKDSPGWVDNFSELDGHQFAQNVNWGNDYSLRGSLAWQVTPNFKVTVTDFYQSDYQNDTPTVRTQSPAMVLPTVTYNEASGTQPNSALPGYNKTGVNGVAFSFPARVLPGFTVPAQTWLGDGNGTTNGRYLTPTDVQYISSPRRTIFNVPSIVLDYNWNDKLSFKSITAYDDARTSGWTFTGGFNDVRPLPGFSPQGITNQAPLYGGLSCNAAPGQPGIQGTVGLETPILTPTCTLGAQYLPQTWTGQGSTTGPSDAFGYYFFNNRRGQTTQEFRVSTTDPSWRVQFVLGAFIEHEHNHINVGSSWNETQMSQAVLGVPEQWFQGTLAAPVLETPGNPLFDVSTRNIDILEDEQSVFGEFTFAVTSKFKITAGVRAVNYSQQFLQIYGGTVASAPSGWYGTADNGSTPTVDPKTGKVLVPTSGIDTNPNSLAPFPVNYGACPQHITASNVSAAAQTGYAQNGCPYQYTFTKLPERPVTPKVGASYQLTTNDMVYVTYAEGYRPGGINPFVPPVMCATDLATLGLAQSPATYGRDSVKSTEVGGKFRLFNGQAQLNAAAFHITWDNVQFVESLPTCAFSFTANAATAASDGGELQFTGRAMGFTLNANVAYDNARYTKTTLAPGTTKKLVNAGDNLGVPDWTGNIGLQYDTRIMEFPAYARLDYAYTGKYWRSTGPGTNSFNTSVNPNFYLGNETHLMNARVGVYYKDLEIAGYVTNLFNSQEWINKSEGLNTYYYLGIKETPRVVGVQMNYRF